MKHILTYSVVALLSLTVAAVDAEAKKKDKEKDHDRDRDHVVYVERDRDGDRYYRDHDRDRDRTRTIYVIENDRPVERVVYIDSDGRYYRWLDGRRVYVRGRYYESYPSHIYSRERRPSVSFSVPF